jgi:hypothetical protein
MQYIVIAEMPLVNKRESAGQCILAMVSVKIRELLV